MSAPPPFSHKCDVLRFQYGVYGEVEDDKLVAYTQFPCRLAAADSKLLLTVGYVGPLPNMSLGSRSVLFWKLAILLRTGKGVLRRVLTPD